MASTIEALLLAQQNFLLRKPLAQLLQFTAQTIGTADTPITFDTSVYDPWSGHSTVTNPSRWTAPVAAYYRLAGTAASADTGTTNAFWAGFHYNGGFIDGSLARSPGAIAGQPRVWSVPSIIQFMNVGDYVEMFMASTVGTVQTAVTSGNFCSFNIEFDRFA